MARLSKLTVAILLFLCSCCPTHPVVATDQAVTWTFDANRAGGRFADLTFKLGDTITFSWPSSSHDVQRHTENDCVVTGAVSLFAAVAGPATFAYEFEEPGDFFFACDVGTHCNAGDMLLKAHVCSIWERLKAFLVAIFTLFLWRLDCLSV
jgi:plastocyanin